MRVFPHPFDEEEKEDVSNILNRLSHSAPRIRSIHSDMLEERKTLSNAEVI